MGRFEALHSLKWMVGRFRSFPFGALGLFLGAMFAVSFREDLNICEIYETFSQLDGSICGLEDLWTDRWYHVLAVVEQRALNVFDSLRITLQRLHAGGRKMAEGSKIHIEDRRNWGELG